MRTRPALRVAAAVLMAAGSGVARPATFADVAPILGRFCAPCHHTGGSAPFPLVNYEQARAHAAQIARVTARRYMPPWLPEPGYGDFADVRRLTEAQIALLGDWVRGGIPEGGRSAAPPLQFPDGWQLGKPDLVLHMRQPYRLAAEGTDVFRNFVVPAELAQTRYIRAVELRPGDARVVHHANLIVDGSRMLRRRDGADGQPGFAGMDVATEVSGEFDPDSHFLFWKPGSPPEQEPADMAWKLDPGSDLILNLHLRPTGKPETVDVMVGLYFAERPPSRFPMLLQLEHDGALDIPAGDAQFAVADHLKLPVAVDVLAIYPHAHYLGKRIEAWAELPDGSRRWLLKIGAWNIDWQAVYTYRAPVALPAGTTVAMRVVYDNSTANVRNPNQPPHRVRGGNRSVDEMGHVWLQVLPRRAEENGVDARLLLQEALMRRRIEKYPADFEAYFNLGAALQNEDRHEDALRYLQEAVRIRPASATARNNLAVSLFATGKLGPAAGELQKALVLDPEYQNARFNLGRVRMAAGDAAGALEVFLKYLEAAPRDAQAHEFAARLYAERGELAAALPHFRAAAELQPDDSALETNLGTALARAGELREAITAFERALKTDPGNETARQNLERARAAMVRK